MDKLQLTGQNLGRVFDFRSGHLHAATFLISSVKLPNLQLKTRPKQLLGSLLLVIKLPRRVFNSRRGCACTVHALHLQHRQLRIHRLLIGTACLLVLVV
jgi:hypothetical protein